MRLRSATGPARAPAGSIRASCCVIFEVADSPNAGKASRRPFADIDSAPFMATFPGLTPARAWLRDNRPYLARPFAGSANR
jgi:hypothetical protein